MAKGRTIPLDDGVLAPLLLKLARRDHTLSAEEAAVLRASVSELQEFGPDEDVVREQERVNASNLLVEGWTSRYITLADGRRQIVALHVPGDFVDLQSFPLKRMDHSVGTLTRCRLASVPHQTLLEITESHPHLTRLLWLSTLIDSAILRQWLVSSGQRSALEQVAHLLCELHSRLKVVGLADDGGFVLPLNQIELGQAMGISAVHANRVVQELRAQGLVRWQGQRIEVLDSAKLQDLAQFDATYLQLEDEPR